MALYGMGLVTTSSDVCLLIEGRGIGEVWGGSMGGGVCVVG